MYILSFLYMYENLCIFWITDNFQMYMNEAILSSTGTKSYA